MHKRSVAVARGGFPDPWAAAVAAATIGEDQHGIRVGIAGTALGAPPALDTESKSSVTIHRNGIHVRRNTQLGQVQPIDLLNADTNPEPGRA